MIEYPSRRDALRSSGLITVGAVSSSVIPSTAHGRIVFGANRTAWSRFDAAMPAGIQRSVRVYYDYGPLPQAWPSRTGTDWVTLSLRPSADRHAGPRALLNGTYDAQLKAIIASAPAHSQLCFFHELEGGNPMGYVSSYMHPSVAVQIQQKGMELCAGSKVKFGVVICGPANHLEKWIAPKLDWYGVDIYFNHNFATPSGFIDEKKLYSRLSNDLHVFRSLSGIRNPHMAFPETNAHRDEHRARWFTLLSQWSTEHNVHRIQTRWFGQQGHSGPWPPSRSVINRLRYLSKLYR
jgi:hypothetical protein